MPWKRRKKIYSIISRLKEKGILWSATKDEEWNSSLCCIIEKFAVINGRWEDRILQAFLFQVTGYEFTFIVMQKHVQQVLFFVFSKPKHRKEETWNVIFDFGMWLKVTILPSLLFFFFQIFFHWALLWLLEILKIKINYITQQKKQQSVRKVRIVTKISLPFLICDR